MHRVIAAATVAAVLGGCSAVGQLPTFEEWNQAQLNSMQPPDTTPAQRCYTFGALEGTPELERCAAAVTELRKEPYWGVNVPDPDYCGRVALGGSPIYLNCLEARRQMHQDAADAYNGLVQDAVARDERTAAAFRDAAANIQRQQAIDAINRQNSMPVTCTSNGFGGMVTTTCR